MRIATWNINGIRARLEGAVNWTADVRPDILCFQEIKIEDSAFPRSAFADLGYNIESHGQKSFNGVAILSKLPFDEVSRGLPGDAAAEGLPAKPIAVDVDPSRPDHGHSPSFLLPARHGCPRQPLTSHTIAMPTATAAAPIRRNRVSGNCAADRASRRANCGAAAHSSPSITSTSPAAASRSIIA